SGGTPYLREIPNMTFPRLVTGALLLFALVSRACALGPADVYIVFNKNVPASREVADYYQSKRAVPAENLIGLDLPDGEDISRADYDKRLVVPLREALKDRKDRAKVLLTVYGVPLRVGRVEPSADEKAELANLDALIDRYQKRVRALDEEIKRLEAKGKDPPLPPREFAELTERKGEREVMQTLLKPLEPRRRYVGHSESEAAVDSELSLLWWDKYELRRWQVNMLY